MDMFEEDLDISGEPQTGAPQPGSQASSRAPSPTFGESSEDEFVTATQRSGRGSPTFDDESDEGERSDEYDAAVARGRTQGSSRAPSPSFDDDESTDEEHIAAQLDAQAAAAAAARPQPQQQQPRPPPRSAEPDVASLFRTGGGQGVRLSTASVQRGQELLAPYDADGLRLSLFSTGSGQGVRLAASSLQAGRELVRSPPQQTQPSPAARARGTALKRPASPSYDDDDEGEGGAAESDPIAELFAHPASAPRPHAGAAAQGGGKAPVSPAARPQAKQRRRTRVLGPTPSPKLAASAAVHPQYLSRRLQQNPETVAVSSLSISSAVAAVSPGVGCRSTADCDQVLRSAGRSSSFFGNTPADLLNDLTQAGADPKLVDEAWVANHARWIVWKLAGYALHFPTLKTDLPDAPCGFGVESLREQLRYRYDTEKGLGKRSVLRKVMDGDAGMARPMVVCVASVVDSTRLEVTDGWWPGTAVLDDALAARCAAGQISVGDKLWVVGARPPAKESKTDLKPAKEGELVLRFHVNGTRKANRSTKLGWKRMSPRSFGAFHMVFRRFFDCFPPTDFGVL